MDWLLPLLVKILSNPAIKGPAAQIVAKELVKLLPDVSEDLIGEVLVLIGNKIKAANP